MQWTDVSENWMAFVPRILDRWPDLGSDDVDAIEGDRARFVSLLSLQSGMDTSEAEAEIDDFLTGEIPADVMMDPDEDNAQISASGDNIPAGEDASDDDAEFGDDSKLENPVGRTTDRSRQ